jgi:hypothetical protein
MIWNAGQADHGRDHGDIVARLFGEGPAALQIVVVSSGSGIVGRQKAAWAEAVVHLAQIGRAREYIVARFVRIGAEMVMKPQFCVGLGDHLHQPHRALRRQGACVAGALYLHDGADPMRRHPEALRGFGNQ